jgi:hypothetical protein
LGQHSAPPRQRIFIQADGLTPLAGITGNTPLAGVARHCDVLTFVFVDLASQGWRDGCYHENDQQYGDNDDFTQVGHDVILSTDQMNVSQDTVNRAAEHPPKVGEFISQ